MNLIHKNVLILSDIEGSSGCWNYSMSSFMTEDWPEACVDMSLDVQAVCNKLFQQGVDSILVKDFHRTGYNLLPELIDSQAKIVHGYHQHPVPGIGDPGNATAVLMIGMHAPSGSEGFLAHTLTSRISKLQVNGELLSEVELFSASLAPFNIVPIFFSGCPVACSYAEAKVPGLNCFPIDKSFDRQTFDKEKWRNSLADEALLALCECPGKLFIPEGPFSAEIEMRDGEHIARKLANRWNLSCKENTIFLASDNIHDLYFNLMRICYLTPLLEKVLPLALALSNLRGRYGLQWIRRRINR